jgi:hypothetical protein
MLHEESRLINPHPVNRESLRIVDDAIASQTAGPVRWFKHSAAPVKCHPILAI